MYAWAPVCALMLRESLNLSELARLNLFARPLPYGLRLAKTTLQL